MDIRLIRTFNKAPNTQVRAAIIATQASVTAFRFPLCATYIIVSITEAISSATSIGTIAACFVASWITRLRSAFSSSVSFGSLKAANTRSYASLSRSISRISRSRMIAASVAIVRIWPSTSAYFFLPIVRFATISVSAVAIAPFRAEILPPPGTGALPAVSARNPLIVKSTSIVSII